MFGFWKHVKRFTVEESHKKVRKSQILAGYLKKIKKSLEYKLADSAVGVAPGRSPKPMLLAKNYILQPYRLTCKSSHLVMYIYIKTATSSWGPS